MDYSIKFNKKGVLPLKLPLIIYGIMPSGQTLSGLAVAALLLRRRIRLAKIESSFALLLAEDLLSTANTK